MKNIHVLPTDKPSRLWMTKLGNLTRCHDIKPIKEALGNNVNIYITNDEEIKKGDWFWKPDCNMIFKAEYTPHKGCQKVILTTDQDLIKDGIQAIDDEFLEWFVKNPSCEEVEVEEFEPIYGHQNNSNSVLYKIIIPSVEPKQETLEKYSERFDNDKSAIGNPETWGKRVLTEEDIFNQRDIDAVTDYIGKETSKQETLEEAAEIYASHSLKEERQKDLNMGFKAGAKWQQERSYSEEDMIVFGEFIFKHTLLAHSKGVKNLFEQFKNK